MIGSTSLVRKATSRISPKQFGILVNLASQTPAVIAEAEKLLGDNDAWNTDRMRRNIGSAENALSRQIADELMRRKFGSHDRERLMALKESRPDIPWSAEVYLGRPPTRSESASISNSLRQLERRGLIIRVDLGKSGRTSRVRLTPTGVRAVVEQIRVQVEDYS